MDGISVVKAAGLEAQIPRMFLGITEPEQSGKSNGLRALFTKLGVPMLALLCAGVSLSLAGGSRV